jgi:hypothetical protein
MGDPDSVWGDENGRLHCETCDRISELQEEDALAAGWCVTWDGALCPSCTAGFRKNPLLSEDEPKEYNDHEH